MADKCHIHNDSDWDLKFCDEMKIMLACAYIQLILPMFSIGGSFMFRKDRVHILGANLPALCSMISGSLFLALEYRGKLPFLLFCSFEENNFRSSQVYW